MFDIWDKRGCWLFVFKEVNVIKLIALLIKIIASLIKISKKKIVVIRGHIFFNFPLCWSDAINL